MIQIDDQRCHLLVIAGGEACQQVARLHEELEREQALVRRLLEQERDARRQPARIDRPPSTPPSVASAAALARITITSPAARATGVRDLPPRQADLRRTAAGHGLPARHVAAHDRELEARHPPLEDAAVDVHRQLLTPPGAAGVALAAPSRPIDLPRHRHGPLLRLVLPVEGQRGIDVLALFVDAHDVVVHSPPPPSC